MTAKAMSGSISDEVPFSASAVLPSVPTRPGWRWFRLTDLARLATGHTPSRREPTYWNGDIPWLQLPDIRALDGQIALKTLEHTNEQGIANSAAVLLPEGTVYMSRTASVGFVTIMGRPMATSQDFVNWVCGPELSPRFLMHLFTAARRQIRELGSGAVHHTIYFPTVEAFSVCIPPREEQERIAARLTGQLAAVDRARAAAQARLAAAEALPAAYLREDFEGLTVPLVELRTVSQAVTDGTHLPPPFTASGIPFLFVRNIIAGRIDFNVQKYVSEESYAQLTQKYRAERGDILFSAVGSFGVAVVVETDERFVFQRHIAHIKPDHGKIDPHFLAMFLNSAEGRSQSEAVALGCAQRTVTLQDLRRFAIPLPPLSTQRSIATDLSHRFAEVDRLTNILRCKLAAIEALPAALLREAFNGND